MSRTKYRKLKVFEVQVNRFYSNRLHSKRFSKMAFVVSLGLMTACQPSVRFDAPSEPIQINLNVNLDANVNVRLEHAAREDIEENPEIF